MIKEKKIESQDTFSLIPLYPIPSSCIPYTFIFSIPSSSFLSVFNSKSPILNADCRLSSLPTFIFCLSLYTSIPYTFFTDYLYLPITDYFSHYCKKIT